MELIYNSRNYLGLIDRMSIVCYLYLQQQKLFRSYRLSSRIRASFYLQQQKLFRSYRHYQAYLNAQSSTTVEIIQVLQTLSDTKCLSHLQQQKLFRSYRHSFLLLEKIIYNSRNYLGLIDTPATGNGDVIYNSRNYLGLIDM